MSAYLPIEGGLGAVKAGFDLVKGVRELLKKEKVDVTEVNGKLVQLQNSLLDARSALIEAQSYIETLEEERDQRQRIEELERLMVFRESVYRKRTGNGNDVEPDPYCPACWEGKERRLSHLTPGATNGTYSCQIDDTSYRTDEYDSSYPKFLARPRRR